MILVTFSFKFIFLLSGVQSCIDSETEKCCHNYYKNNSGHCIECPLGTFGKSCSGHCPSGFFGRLCQVKCTCEADICDRRYGCSPQTDWLVTSSSTAKSNTRNKGLSTDLTTKVMSPPSWKNTVFIGIGSVGTLFVVGVMYWMKSRFIRMKTRAVGNPTRSPVPLRVEFSALGNNINLRNNESEENTHQTSSYTGLLVEETIENVTPGKGKGFEPYSTIRHYEQNEDEYIASKNDNLENVYQDAWSGKIFDKNKTSSNISKSSKLKFPQNERGKDFTRRPYSSVKYNREYDKGAKGEDKSPSYNSVDISMTGGKGDQTSVEKASNHVVLSLEDRDSINKDVASVSLEYEDLIVHRSDQLEHYTDLTHLDDPLNSDINEYTDIKEREFLVTRDSFKATENVTSPDTYAVPTFPGNESSLNVNISVMKSKPRSDQIGNESSGNTLLNGENNIAETELSFYEDVIIAETVPI